MSTILEEATDLIEGEDVVVDHGAGRFTIRDMTGTGFTVHELAGPDPDLSRWPPEKMTVEISPRNEFGEQIVENVCPGTPRHVAHIEYSIDRQRRDSPYAAVMHIDTAEKTVMAAPSFLVDPMTPEGFAGLAQWEHCHASADKRVAGMEIVPGDVAVYFTDEVPATQLGGPAPAHSETVTEEARQIYDEICRAVAPVQDTLQELEDVTGEAGEPVEGSHVKLDIGYDHRHREVMITAYYACTAGDRTSNGVTPRNTPYTDTVEEHLEKTLQEAEKLF